MKELPLSDPDDPVWTEIELQLCADHQRGNVKSVEEYQCRYQVAPGKPLERLHELYDALTARSASASSEPPFERIGKYHLGQEIGRGGQARVYRATRDGLDRLFAIKLLDSRGASEVTRSRFRREAQMAARLDHTGLCRVHDHGEHEEFLWFVMSVVPGMTLASHLEAANSLKLPEALKLFEQAAEALQYAHDHGVVHRDVTPNNVMIHEHDGRAVLIDFGIAFEPDRDEQRQTRSGDILGTREYLAPEQVLGEGADGRTDVYALGVTMFRTLSGQVPFSAPSDTALHDKIRNERAPRLSQLRAGLPPELDVVIATAMEKDRSDRYESAAALAADLRRVRHGKPIEAKPVSTWRRVALWTARNRGWAWTVASAAGLLIATTAVAVFAAVRADAQRSRSDQLAGWPAFEALRAQAKAELIAPNPARIRLFEQWLQRAEQMLAEAPLRLRQLEELREQAEPQSDLDRARDRVQYDIEYANLDQLARELTNGPLSESRNTYRNRILDRVAFRYHYTFADYEQQIRHDVLRNYVLLLKKLAGTKIGNTNNYHDMKHRLELARSLRDRLDGEDGEAWRWCQEYLRAEPRYGDLSIEPIPGFVPLGFDRDSGLLEFWHVTSGSRPQWQGEALGAGKVQLGDGVDDGMVFVLLPGGTFVMGTNARVAAYKNREPNAYDKAYKDETPPNEVALAPFLLSKFEVTCAQYERSFGNQRSVVGEKLRPRDPQAWVSWDAVERASRSWGLVLPTEAQWEYACRAGTVSPFSTGWTWQTLAGHANFGGVTGKKREHYDGFDGVAPIGSFAPNAFGIHDMHGNVGEWCLDGAGLYAQFQARAGDGLRGHLVGLAERHSRGAHYGSEPWDVRSARRWRQRPSFTAAGTGFRPARSITIE